MNVIKNRNVLAKENFHQRGLEAMRLIDSENNHPSLDDGSPRQYLGQQLTSCRTRPISTHATRMKSSSVNRASKIDPTAPTNKTNITIIQAIVDTASPIRKSSSPASSNSAGGLFRGESKPKFPRNMMQQIKNSRRDGKEAMHYRPRRKYTQLPQLRFVWIFLKGSAPVSAVSIPARFLKTSKTTDERNTIRRDCHHQEPTQRRIKSPRRRDVFHGTSYFCHKDGASRGDCSSPSSSREHDDHDESSRVGWFLVSVVERTKPERCRCWQQLAEE
jgi:hypothetical protein